MNKPSYGQVPFYSLLAIIFSLAVWSLFFPQLFSDRADNAQAAVDFGSATTVSSTVVSGAKTNMLHVNGVYYLAFSSQSRTNSSDSAVFLTTSTDGASWSFPVVALPKLAYYTGTSTQPYEFGFVYNSYRQEFAITGVVKYASNEFDIEFVTSTNGYTWSATNTIYNDTGGAVIDPTQKAPLSFSTSTGMYLMGYTSGGYFYFSTSTNGVSWAQEKIFADADDEALNSDVGWWTNVEAVYVRGGSELHAIYSNVVSSSASGFTEVLYASSSNFGTTWTTTTVSGRLSTTPGTLLPLDGLIRGAFNHDGQASVMYYKTTEYSPDGGGTIGGVVYFASRSATSSQWTTSTLDSAHYIDALSGSYFVHDSSLIYYTDGRVATAIFADESQHSGVPKIEFRAQSTSTVFSETDTFSVSSNYSPNSKLSLAYSTSTQTIGLAYINAGTLNFVTSTLRNAAANATPTSTPFINPVTATSTSSAGRVTVTTTVSDADNDTLSLSVEWSVNGTTWNPAMISSATGSSDTPDAGTGSITNIDSTSGDGNSLTFVWDSASDVPNYATTTAKLRVRVSDSLSATGSYVTSSNFTIDNLAPSSTTFVSVDPSATTMTFVWNDANGASTYLVSSTASSTYSSGSATTTILTSLTPNSVYSAQIGSQDAYGNVSISNVTSSYTDAAVPSSVSVSAQGPTSMAVSWGSNSNASGTNYELVNVTTGATVATTQSTSYTVTGLTPNTAYQFKVRAQFIGDTSQYSEYSSTSASVNTLSSGGGGGSPSNPPRQVVNEDGETVKAVVINDDAAETANRTITLKFEIQKAVQMVISENKDFEGASYESYTATKQWTLSEGNGTKTIYVKFRASDGSETKVSDTITLAGQGFDAPEETVGCLLGMGGAYKTPNSPAVYYITDKCEKRAFSNAQKFLSYFSSWSEVETIPSTALDSIPNDSLGFMPWGPLWKPMWGALVKHPGDAKVYLLLNNEKYWLTSETVFNALYGKDAWNWIEDVDSRLLDNYETGSEVNYTNHHPNFTIVKYADSSEVYRLEPDPNDSSKQVKRHIKNEAAFNKLGFRWDRIVTIPSSEQYITGAELN